jgi:hypothetical protein
MTETTSAAPRTMALYQVFKLLVIAWIVFNAYDMAPEAISALASGDNDDIMRLMSIRAWLNGQSWFDMTQYRLLPPDGVPMHWSRYVDLGIASILVPLSKVLPMAQAEQWTLVIWPTLLLILFVLLVARGTLLTLGPVAAGVAMLSVILWGPTGSLYFKVAKLDHHSVQMLTTCVLAFAMIWPGHPMVRGIIAGAAAAFALAVGLETLPFIGLAGTVLLVRASLGREGADQLLLAFCVTLVVASTLLFVGQTPPAAWLKSECDKLSPPILAIALIAAVASLVPMAAARRLGHPVARLAVSATLVGIGMWLSAPLFVSCLDGPYGALSADVQAAISSQISEALPGTVLAVQRPLTYNRLVTPVIGALILAGFFWYRRRRTADPAESSAVGQMLVLGCIGFVSSFFQIRAIIMSAPAVAFLTGYAILCLLQHRTAHRTALSAALFFAGVTITLFAPKLNGPVLQLVNLTLGEKAATVINPMASTTDCRDPKVLSALDSLPPATIFANMDLSTSMILTTHHSGVAAPYHRSQAAMMNGFFGFSEVDVFQTVLKSTGASYVVLCRTVGFDKKNKVAVALLDGEPMDFLRPIMPDNADMLIYEVLPGALEP